MKKRIAGRAKRALLKRPHTGRRFRPYSQLDLEELGIENFVFGDGSELDWDDPNVGYRRNMLNDHS